MSLAGVLLRDKNFRKDELPENRDRDFISVITFCLFGVHGKGCTHVGVIVLPCGSQGLISRPQAQL